MSSNARRDEDEMLNWYHDHRPSDVDRLGFEPYVRAVRKFLREAATNPPVTLSVEGPWGAGKTTFMRLLQKNKDFGLASLPQDQEPATVWFNAWRNDKEEALWAAFAVKFTEDLRRQTPFWKRPLIGAKLLLSRFDWDRGLLPVLGMAAHGVLWLAVVALLVLLSVFPETFLPLNSVLTRVAAIAGFGAVAAKAVGSADKLLGNPFARDLSAYVEKIDYRSRLCFAERFHRDFRRVVRAYAPDRPVYVFIDDLDRCRVPRAADLIESLTLLVAGDTDEPGEPGENLVFILGMDREKVAAGIAAKHEQLLPYLPGAASSRVGEKGAQDSALRFGYAFVEKLVHVPFRIPVPSRGDFLACLQQLRGERGASTVISEPQAPFREDAPARDVPERNESEPEVDAASSASTQVEPAAEDTEDTRGNEDGSPEIAQEWQEFADNAAVKDIRHLDSMAVETFRANPRLVFKFRELFMLRFRIGYETDLAREGTERFVHVPQLAKVVLLDLRWPRLLNDLQHSPDLIGRIVAPRPHEKGEQVPEAEREEEGEAEHHALAPEPDAEAQHWRQKAGLVDLLEWCPGDADRDRWLLEGVNMTALLETLPVRSLTEADVVAGMQAEIPRPPSEDVDCEVRSDFTAKVEERGEDTAAVRLTGGVELPLKKIPAGEFMMGSRLSPDEVADRYGGKTEWFKPEHPRHRVRITRPFYLGVTPVTQAQWEAVMSPNPSRFSGDERPVEQVNWHEAREFCRALSEKTGRQFDLPTEAQWEYACRADPDDRGMEYCFGDAPDQLAEYACFDRSVEEGTLPVMQKEPNDWDLYDVHGNVWEWCRDYYDGDYYEKSPEEDPCNLEESPSRVLRGGSCLLNPGNCRSAFRLDLLPFLRFYYRGFRVLLRVRE